MKYATSRTIPATKTIFLCGPMSSKTTCTSCKKSLCLFYIIRNNKNRAVYLLGLISCYLVSRYGTLHGEERTSILRHRPPREKTLIFSLLHQESTYTYDISIIHEKSLTPCLPRARAPHAAETSGLGFLPEHHSPRSRNPTQYHATHNDGYNRRPWYFAMDNRLCDGGDGLVSCCSQLQRGAEANTLIGASRTRELPHTHLSTRN